MKLKALITKAFWARWYDDNREALMVIGIMLALVSIGVLIGGIWF